MWCAIRSARRIPCEFSAPRDADAGHTTLTVARTPHRAWEPTTRGTEYLASQ